MESSLIQIALWVLGGLGAIVAALLSWIAFMIREEREQNKANYDLHDKRLRKHDKILLKHDKKFDKQHSEIKELILVMNQPKGNK